MKIDHIEIKQTIPTKYRETENVIREAFWNHYSPACVEHYMIHLMRKCPTYVPELDIMAMTDNKIVGCALCLKSFIQGDNGQRYEVLSLGPIGVLPEYQYQGIGGMLIERTKNIAKQMGFRAILLCGDPDYYSRQGFIAAEQYKIRTSENLWFDALHACELYSDALEPVSGRYFEDDVYNIDETLAKEYDRQFTTKEIITDTPMQQRFEMMMKRMRPY